MSRYTGSVCKLCRREQTKLHLKGDKCITKCVFDRRPAPPGVAKPQRGKPSEYAIRLREKQKLRRMILINESQFETLVNKASKSRTASGDHLLGSLEMRLDNIVRRMGLATSLKNARQLVSHGHVKLNGKSVRVPSCPVKVGGVVSLDLKLKENVGVKLSLDTAKRQSNRPTFVDFDEEKLSGKVIRQPERAEMSFQVNDQLIIEYYSK